MNQQIITRAIEILEDINFQVYDSISDLELLQEKETGDEKTVHQ